MKRMATLSLWLLVAALLAGCHIVTPEELRAKTKFHASYVSDLPCETVYRRVVEAAELFMMGIDYQDEIHIRHAIFTETNTAWVYRHDFNGDSLARWICDIKGTPTGCAIEVYGDRAFFADQAGEFLERAGARPKP